MLTSVSRNYLTVLSGIFYMKFCVFYALEVELFNFLKE